MRRPFGLIGLTYLSVLTVVFYCPHFWVKAVIVAMSVAAVIVALIIKAIRPNVHRTLAWIAAAITALCAVSAVFIYQKAAVDPIVYNYSDKEIKFAGYIYNEPQLGAKAVNYIIQTETIDGEPVTTKLAMESYSGLELEAFDSVSGTGVVHTACSTRELSNGVFLDLDEGGSDIRKTGEDHPSVNAPAYYASRWVNDRISQFFRGNEAALVRAVLLGDKQSLDPSIRSDFTRTGTSYLIVVSGMHLSLVTAGFMFLCRKIGIRLPLLICMLLLIFSYMAVTGFPRSVVRAGIMHIIIVVGYYLPKTPDSVNSLGISALVLTILNPYAVGDVGMLLSFSATLGIVLWATPLYHFLLRFTRLSKLYSILNKRAKEQAKREKSTRKTRALMRLLKIPSAILAALSVSAAASLWVIPVSLFAFGKISPLVVIISLVATPLTTLVLWFSALTVALFWCPFLPFALAWCADLCCKLLIWVVSSFAKLPYAQINADEPYFYVWLGVSVLLALVGAVICYRELYVPAAVTLSFVTLLVGWSLSELYADRTPYLTVYSDGTGVTVSVTRGHALALLSCGGSHRNYHNTEEALLRTSTVIDTVIIPKSNYSHARYLNYFYDTFDVSQVLVYDNSNSTADIEWDSARFFSSNQSFKVPLNSMVTDVVYANEKTACQYIKSPSVTVLYLTSGSDIMDLPPEHRDADYVITEGMPKNLSQLSCRNLYFTGTNAYFDRYRESFEKVSQHVGSIRGQTAKIPLS